MKKKYIAPAVAVTKCQLLGFITASNHGADAEVPDGKKDPINPDPDEPEQHAKWNTGWEGDWDSTWED